MKTKRGDLWKCANPEFRGLKGTFYYYCVMGDSSAYMMANAIITQKGELLINKSKIEEWSDEIVAFGKDKFDYFDLELTSIEDFMKNKDDFKKNTIISFNHKKYEYGIIRKIDAEKKTLKVEVTNDDTEEEKEIKISFDDVTIVYPEFTFNDRRQFQKI